MPSPICPFVISLVVRLPIRRGTGEIMNVLVWEHDALNNRFFYVAKFTIIAPLLLLS